MSRAANRERYKNAMIFMKYNIVKTGRRIHQSVFPAEEMYG